VVFGERIDGEGLPVHLLAVAQDPAVGGDGPPVAAVLGVVEMPGRSA
jgi:hypothetical protein